MACRGFSVVVAVAAVLCCGLGDNEWGEMVAEDVDCVSDGLCAEVDGRGASALPAANDQGGMYHRISIGQSSRNSPSDDSESFDDQGGEPGALNSNDKMPASQARISVITLTSQRRARYHSMIYSCFKFQSRDATELIVVDDPGVASDFFTRDPEASSDHRVRYVQTDTVLTVGAKRNAAVELATGDIIVTFDDDDLYAPAYVERMVQALETREADIVKLGSFHHYNIRTGALAFFDGFESPCDQHVWGYGFTYVYRKTAWAEAGKFGDVSFGEDYDLLQRMRTAGMRTAMARSSLGLERMLVLHGINGDNLSALFSSHVFLKPESLHQLFAGQCRALRDERAHTCRNFFGGIGESFTTMPTGLEGIRPLANVVSTAATGPSCSPAQLPPANDVPTLIPQPALRDLVQLSRIPPILVFSAPTRLLDTTGGSDDDVRDRRTLNRTLQMHPRWAVRFYVDADCEALIRRMRPQVTGLLRVFRKVKYGPYRADICRLVALFTHGGVYLDVNMPVRAPLESWLDPDATFVSAFSICRQHRDFFQSILAATPRHPALLRALRIIVAEHDPGFSQPGKSQFDGFPGLVGYYKGGPFCMGQVGTAYTYQGWRAWREHDEKRAKKGGRTAPRHKSQILYEMPHFVGTFLDVRRRALHLGENDVPSWTMCNMLVFDPASGTVPFYSHPVGRKIDRRADNDPLGLGYCEWELDNDTPELPAQWWV